jgi:hypothetical protein
VAVVGLVDGNDVGRQSGTNVADRFGGIVQETDFQGNQASCSEKDETGEMANTQLEQLDNNNTEN